MRFVALADDFNFKSRVGFGQSSRHIAERQGLLDAVSECTGGDPTNGLAVVPDRLIAYGVGIRGIDLESQQAQCAAALPFFRGRRTPDELTLLEVDESIESCLKGPVDGAVFPRPAAETLFNAHGIQGAPSE